MSTEEFHKLNNTAQYCTVLAFDEKRGLQSEDIAELLSGFREILESSMSEEDYDDFSVFVTPIHNGEDPEFLCYLRKEPFTEQEAISVYEFIMNDDISLDDEEISD